MLEARWQCAVIAFDDPYASRKPQFGEPLLAESCLDGTDRDSRSMQRPLPGEIREAAPDAAPQVEDVRWTVGRHRLQFAQDLVLDEPEGVSAIDYARTPHRAVDGADTAALATAHERRRVGVVVALNVSGRKARGR